MRRLGAGILVALILQITAIPVTPALGGDRLPGRGEDEAPADQPTRRPAEDPGTAAPTPAGEDTGAPSGDDTAAPSPDVTAPVEEGSANDPFGADPAEATGIDTGAGITAALWVLVVLAASGACWAGLQRIRR